MLNIPENIRRLKTVAPSLALAVCLVAPPLAAQDGGTDGVQVDISDWSCEYCPDVSGWSGELSLGTYYVSDDSAKFGDYTGLNEQGAYLLLDGDTRYIGKDGYYMDLYFDDLGLDSRSISLEGGRQGSYQYSFSYSSLPHYLYDTARTPFTGGDTLTLPAGWVTAGTTGGMTALDANLLDVDVFSERETVGVGAKLIQSSRWEYSADFNQSTKSGTKIIGGSFMNTSALLPSPIDYTTDQAELKASYSGRKLQAQLGYYVSVFSNENKALSWQNPFTEIAAGGDTGQLALEPDNSFHQLAASTGFQLDSSTATRLLAGFSVGHMQQDDDYLSATINPDLTTSALPRNSLDGEVDTLSYNVRLSTRPIRDFSLNLTIQYNERDNNTPVDAYEHVDTDVFVSLPRSNVPYSFKRRKAAVDMTYKLPNNIRLVTGVEVGSYERSLLGSSKTDEDRIWAEISANVFDMVDLRLKLVDDSRRNKRVDWLTVFVTGENPYLQKFNMADRERDEASLSASVSPLETLTVSLTADITDDDYYYSSIGLTDAEQTGYTLDFSWVPVKAVSLYWFASRESIESNMAGSTDFVGSVQFEPNWYAHQQDTIDTIGIGVEFAELFEKVDFGFSYNHSESEGEINLRPAPASAFPDLVTDLDSANFYLKYRMSKSMGLRFSYLAERYKSNDWGFNNVEPDTVPAVLTPGQQIFDYDVNLVSVVLDYRF